MKTKKNMMRYAGSDWDRLLRSDVGIILKELRDAEIIDDYCFKRRQGEFDKTILAADLSICQKNISLYLNRDNAKLLEEPVIESKAHRIFIGFKGCLFSYQQLQEMMSFHVRAHKNGFTQEHKIVEFIMKFVHLKTFRRILEAKRPTPEQDMQGNDILLSAELPQGSVSFGVDFKTSVYAQQVARKKYPLRPTFLIRDKLFDDSQAVYKKLLLIADASLTMQNVGSCVIDQLHQ